jgi:hypothetical protein
LPYPEPYADPDQNFMLMPMYPDPDPDWHQKDANPHADPTPSVTHVGKSNFFLLLVTAFPVYNDLSHQLS